MCLSRILAVSRAESKSRDVPRAPVVPPRRGSSKLLRTVAASIWHLSSKSKERPLSVLPLIKASCPLPVQDIKGDWLENVGLDVYDDPSPPPPVQPEKTPELTFNLPSKSLDTLFSARLLGNETPEPKGVKEFLATPEYEYEEIIKKTAEELIKHLESFKVGVPVISLYERLMDRLMDELETLFHIKITHQLLGGRLFSDENGAISHIVNEAYKRLLKKHLIKGASCFDPWAINYAADAILAVLTVLCDLSDECSEIFKAYQIYRRYGPANRPCTYLVKCTESPLEDSPDFSHSIPAVQVTEASEDLVDNNKDLETPAYPDGEVLRMPPHLEK
ncbi:hypothetical protein AOLI_G00180260 [Acnodon oligacanthus]